MNYLKLSLIFLLSNCSSLKAPRPLRDFTQDTTFLTEYPLILDPLSSPLTSNDTSMIDEIIFTSELFDRQIIDSAYVYKDTNYTFYLEYYSKSTTITYFLSKGYIRKKQLIEYENKTRNLK
jgi:hypothetical protein